MAKPENATPTDQGTVDLGPHHWFVVANGSRAQAWRQRVGTPGYDLIRSWDAPEARMSSAELGEDRPGRVFASAGSAQRSGIESETPATSPQGHAKRAFEAVLAADLIQARRRRELSGLYLIAPAPMLHRLREALPTDLRQVLLGEYAGDFTQRPTADIYHHLDALRRGANPARA